MLLTTTLEQNACIPYILFDSKWKNAHMYVLQDPILYSSFPQTSTDVVMADC